MNKTFFHIYESYKKYIHIDNIMDDITHSIDMNENILFTFKYIQRISIHSTLIGLFSMWRFRRDDLR